MTDIPTIAILMSSYNGARFIKDQINSLINQTYKNWTLYIRDDGSTDGTTDIIQMFQDSHNNIKLIKDSLKLGACQSFMKLLTSVDADYYMFCDQDDFWYPNKIERTLQEMRYNELTNPNLPVAVCSDLTLVDSDLKVIEPSMWRFSGLYPLYLKEWKYLQVCNIFTGCTMMINKAARLLCMKNSSKAKMHDSWIGLNVAANGGRIAPIEEQLILYRQHSANVLGCPPEPGLKYYLNKIKSIGQMLQGIFSQYQVANSIKRTSFVSFYYYKILYQFIRLKNK